MTLALSLLSISVVLPLAASAVFWCYCSGFQPDFVISSGSHLLFIRAAFTVSFLTEVRTVDCCVSTTVSGEISLSQLDESHPILK